MTSQIAHITQSRWFRRLLIGLAAGLIVTTAGLAAWVTHDLPRLDAISAGLALPSTRIYDRNGQLLYEILPPEQGRNTAIALDEIPQHCINAIIATEDANYWQHPGVDIVGILRAAWINLSGGDILAGGSTITQQTARLLLLDPQEQAERTLRRKLREMVLAVQMHSAYSKAHVLALYLNQVYFGNLAYGIEGAARAYFSKGAGDLSLAECALLAGMIQNPALHDPLSNIESARVRQRIALDLMVGEGFITPAEADAAANDALQFGALLFPIQAPHFVMAVWKQLEREYPDDLYGGGLDVITTLDLDWQQAAEAITRQRLDTLNHPADGTRAPANANNAALIAMDPFTGQVLTMMGSPDYFDESIDGAVNATLALRQPGSTLKPFTYAAAMDPDRAAPYTAATMILDVETPFVTRRLESYTPGNFALVEHGPVLVREALASSYNIPAVVALEEVGLGTFIDLMSELGLDELASNARVDLSITLGGGEVQLIDLASAYSAFPNGGFRIDPSLILQVRQRHGDVLYEWQAPKLEQRVMDERVAYIITDILADNQARLPSFGPNSVLQIGRPAAAKTGTTTDFRDNWVVGFTPNLVTGVWVGNADNQPMVDVTGISGAGPIYHAFMRDVLLGQPELTFDEPPGLIRRQVCALSGLLPTADCPLTRSEIFIPGTEPTEADNLHQTLVIDRRTGQLADETTPIADRQEQRFIVLPQEARDWGLRNGIQPPPTHSAVLMPDADVGLRLLEPDPYTVFEVSPVTPIETQRLRLTVGVSADTVEVRYILNGQPIGQRDGEPWDLWWTLELGQHELVAEALLRDGTTSRSQPIPFSVVAWEEPQSQTIPPSP